MATSYSTYSDIELYQELKSAKNIAEKAFAELYSRYSQKVYAFCLRMLGNSDEAQDVFQDTMCKFYDVAQKKEQISNVPAYIITIARNLCLNAIRNRKTTVDIEDFNIKASESSYEQKELLDLIARSLDLLKYDEREIFILRLYHGYSHKEIADITGFTVAAIKNKIWRAKEKVKNILSPYMEDLSD